MIKYNLEKIYTDIVLPACADRKCDGLESLLERVDEGKLLDVCRQNDIASIVGHYLIENVKDRELRPEWADEVRIVKDRTGAYLNELSRIARLFSAKRIKLIGLKNTGIAANLIRNPGLFPMGDVDVLIARENFQAAHEIMLSEGYELKAPTKFKPADFDEGLRNGSNEYEREIGQDIRLWFELIWKPVDGRFIADSQEPPGELLIADSLDNEETHIRALHPVHNLLQVCIHTAKHSYVRAPGFRLHLDVHRIVGNSDVDWDQFLTMAKEHKVCTIVYFSLIMPKLMFGTEVPDRVINAVKPGYLKRSLVWRNLNRAGVFWPKQRKFRLLQFVFFTALLHDGLGSLIEIACKNDAQQDPSQGGDWKRLARLPGRVYKLIFNHVNT